MIITACGFKQEEVVSQNDKNVLSTTDDEYTETQASLSKPVPALSSEEETVTYANERYKYKITYPAKWISGEEFDNGDGKALYIGNPDVDIRVYGVNYIEGITDAFSELKLPQQKILLDNGLEAQMFLGKVNDKYIAKVYYNSEENQTQYFFSYEVSKEFYNKNEQILLKVAKSFNMQK